MEIGEATIAPRMKEDISTFLEVQCAIHCAMEPISTLLNQERNHSERLHKVRAGAVPREVTGDIRSSCICESQCYLKNGLPQEEIVVLPEMFTPR